MCICETYFSVNSKLDHPPSPGDPRGFAHSHCPGAGVSPIYLPLPGVRVLDQEMFDSLEKNSKSFLFVLKKPTAASKAGVFRGVFILPFAKAVLFL